MSTTEIERLKFNLNDFEDEEEMKMVEILSLCFDCKKVIDLRSDGRH